MHIIAPPPPLNQAFFANKLLKPVIPVTQKAFFWQKKGILGEIGSRVDSQRQGLGSIALLAQGVAGSEGKGQTRTEAVGAGKSSEQAAGVVPPTGAPAGWRPPLADSPSRGE